MKNFYLLIFCGLALAACDKNLVDSKQYTVHLKAESESKTSLDGAVVKWESGDKVGVSGPGLVNQESTVQISAEGEPTFKVTLSGSGTLEAYYPYTSDGHMEIPVTQNGDFSVMPMKSVPLEITEGGSKDVTMQFCNFGSVVDFNVTNGPASVNNITLVCGNAIAGTFTADMVGLTCQGLGERTVTTTGQRLIVAPGEFSGVIEINSSGKHYRVPASGVTFNRSHRRTINIDLSGREAQETVRDTIDADGVRAYSGAAYQGSLDGTLESTVSGGNLVSVSFLFKKAGKCELYTGETKLGSVKFDGTATISEPYSDIKLVTAEEAELSRVVFEWR